MDKQKKALSREIDGIIISCALNQGCDETELVRLAIEFATVFRCQYEFSAENMRSMETEEERETVLRLEQKVKLVVKHTIRQRTPGMAQLSRQLMYKTLNKLPNAFMRRCECTASRRYPWCDMPVKFCKHTTLGPAKIVPRKTKSLGTYRARAKSESPRTRKSNGGNGGKRIRKRSRF
jgi:hypothetical protein